MGKLFLFRIAVLAALLLAIGGPEMVSNMQDPANGIGAIIRETIGLKTASLDTAQTTQKDDELVSQASPSVVLIRSYKNVPYSLTGSTHLIARRQVSSGTGFFVTSDGYLLTNRHVVADTQAEYTVDFDGQEIPALVVYRDSDYDLAVLKIKSGTYPALKLAQSSEIKRGERVIGIGNALGKYVDSVSVGKISGLDKSVIVREKGRTFELLQGLIQTNARLYPGDSGGPLLNPQGEVIGVNVATSVRAPISYSIPIEAIQSVIKKAGITLN
jgi:serine protease Do